MTIGELARKAGVNVQTIRYYEREGLLPDAHRWPDSGYRDFDDEALLYLKCIRSANELGFTLREVKEPLDMRIIPGESCAEVRKMIGAKLDDLDRRMVEMRRLRRTLVKLEKACGQRPTDATCPALWAIEKLSAGAIECVDTTGLTNQNSGSIACQCSSVAAKPVCVSADRVLCRRFARLAWSKVRRTKRSHRYRTKRGRWIVNRTPPATGLPAEILPP